VAGLGAPAGEDHDLDHRDEEAPVATDPVIRIEGLSKSFGRAPALRSLSLEVPPGEVLGYLGPNGAGKTTTIRLLLGLIQPSAGRAQIFGLDCHRQPIEAHRRLAYVPGEANLWPQLTGTETLHLLGRISGHFDHAYRDQLIQRFELDPAKRVRAYSKGNRQKLVLIAALMTRADLLIMDEPTSGLDPLMEQAFRISVREAVERGQTVFLSSHILSEVEALSSRVAILRAGQLIEVGTMAELRHLSALTIEVDFEGAPPDLTTVEGVSGVVVEGNRATCHVTGSVDPLLRVLATARVRHLVSRQPTLEELFLAHYGAPDPLPHAA
jgi:ABC-2 type transport system ATP-binding protein